MARLGRGQPNRPTIVRSRTFEAPPAGTPASWRVGAPEAKWSAGAPEVKWDTGPPEPKWHVGAPEGG